MVQSSDKYSTDLKAVIQQLDDGYIELDLYGCITDINASAQRIFNEKTRILLGKNFSSLFQESTFSNVVKNFKTLLVKGKAVKFKASILNESNNITHVEISASIIYKQNKPISIYTIIRDITENFNKQTELQVLTERLLMSETAAKLGCFEYEFGTNNKWWSSQMFAIYDIDEQNGVPDDIFIYDICHDDDKSMLWGQLDGVNNRGDNYNIIHRVITPKNNLKWLNKVGRFKTNNNGFPLFFGTVQDVTALYLEKEQNQKNQHLIAIANKANELLTTNLDTLDALKNCCVYLAKETKVSTVYIYKSIEISNTLNLVVHSNLSHNKAQNISERLNASAERNAKWKERLKKGEILDINDEKLSKDEKTYLTKLGLKSILLIPIQLEGIFYGVLGFDNTDKLSYWTSTEKEILSSFSRKLGYFLQRADFLNNLEFNLRKQQDQNKELTKRNAEIDNFVYATFHDLRSPIANMQGIINLNSTKSISPEKLLYKIETPINKLLCVANKIGDYAKNIKLPIRLEKININAVAQIVNKYLTINVKKEEHLIEKSFDGAEVFTTDMERLKIIVHNLLQNALIFSKSAAKPCISCCFEITLKGLKFSVSNNGEAVRKETQRKIFNMFYTASSLSEGSGMGLYLEKEAVSALGGKISVQSINAKTSFTVILKNGAANNNG